MDRNESSRLGELQAEGNLGNERNRNTDREERERMRNREHNDRKREEWKPSGDVHDTDGMRRDGER